ncbi:MAG: nuclear transport factor 2 family protein [Solirubrobacterales bacterium]
MAGSNAELARRVFKVLSDGDARAFVALVDPEIEIHTSRGVGRGKEVAEAWALKSYDHLERRFAVDELEVDGDEVRALVRTQYVWRDDGELANEEPTTVDLRFRDGKLVRWTFREDRAAERHR